MTQVYISICIPAYKRVDFLKKLLDSIKIQSFRDYEVVISDDSPGRELEDLVNSFRPLLPSITYCRNVKAMGTPANWNEAILHAKGEWIKLMHDDDWFSQPDSLAKFAAAAANKQAGIIFSSYYDVFLRTGKQKRILPPVFRSRILKKEPVSLLSRNIIGPPSVVMHRNDSTYWYDPNLKWLVDIDMYVRRLEKETLVYIPETLISVGIGEEQVTVSVHGSAKVEIPEHFYFLQKTGIERLENILVYDYWWRFIRNFRLFSLSDIKDYGWNENVHPAIIRMMKWEKKIPNSILKFGLFSKAIMFFHYLLYKRKLKSTLIKRN